MRSSPDPSVASQIADSSSNAATLNGSERAELLADVASLYYELGEDQVAIAKRYNVSRSKVSRWLSEARDKGLVEIRVLRPLPTDEALREQARGELGLNDAVVLDARRVRKVDVQARVGALAARYLESRLATGDTLAISWGTALRAIANALQPRHALSVDVVQMIGGAGSLHPEIDGTELARAFADRLGGRHYYLQAPLMVDSPATRQALLQQPSLRAVLERAARARLAVVGIGAVLPGVSAPLRAGYLTVDDLARLRESGVVGDLCGQHYDSAGRILDIEVNHRTVCLDPDALRQIPCVIGVAMGSLKTRAILGAVRGRLIDVLITDSATLEEVMRLEGHDFAPAESPP